MECSTIPARYIPSSASSRSWPCRRSRRPKRRNETERADGAGSHQHPFDASRVRELYVPRQPVRTQQILRDLDHDVIGVRFRVVVVALQSLEAGGTGRQYLHLAAMAAGADLIHPDPHLFFLAKAHLGGYVGPGDRESAGLAAASVVLLDGTVARAVHQRVHHLERIVLLHRRVAGIVIHVAHASDVLEHDALLHEELMDVDDLAAGEDLLELVALELIEAGPAAHHHGFYVEIVQCIGDAVEQHAIVGDDLFGLVELAGAALRVAAAEISRRQHGLNSDVPQHGLSRKPDLREQALRTAARKIEHRFGLAARFARITDDGYVVAVLDVEQRARGFLRQTARHTLVDEVDDLLLDRRAAFRCGRPLGLGLGERLEDAVRQPLPLVAPPDQG